MEVRPSFILASLAVALMFYFCYNPIPPDVDEPWKLRALSVVLKVNHYATLTCEYLGFGTYWNITRSIHEKVADVVNTDPDLEIDDTYFHGVRVRVYKPRGRSIKEKSGGIIYFHGGGWIVGSVLVYDVVTRTLAKKTKMVVVSVDYRLAPEFPFPTPFFDCEIATKYFIENANTLNVDPNRIVLMGDSAGGNIAAAVALKLRGDPIQPKPKLQVLVYPITQAIDFLLPSYVENSKYSYLTAFVNVRQLIAAFLMHMAVTEESMVDEFLQNMHTSAHVKQHYYEHTDAKHLPEEFVPEGYTSPPRTGGNIEISRRYEAYYLNEYFSPLLAGDLTNLPDAYILICEYDVLRDDGMLYAKKLGAAKVNVTLEHYQRGFHGIINLVTRLQIADKMMDDIAKYVKDRL